MKTKTSDRLFLLLLIGLLLLRFPLVILPRYGLLPISTETAMTLFDAGTYLLVGITILLKRNSLAEYHIDRFALTLLLLAPAGWVGSECLMNGWQQVRPAAWMNLALSVLLLIALLIWRPTLPKRGTKHMLRWAGIALAVGFCLSVAMGWLIHFQNTIQFSDEVPLFRMVPYAVIGIFQQLGYAAAIEEPLFRGFLWGFLKERHWKDMWIWLFQAFLFMMGHIYYFGTLNVSFWVGVPLGALVMGLVAWKSRSIGTGMIVHGMTNSLAGGLFRYLF